MPLRDKDLAGHFYVLALRSHCQKFESRLLDRLENEQFTRQAVEYGNSFEQITRGSGMSSDHVGKPGFSRRFKRRIQHREQLLEQGSETGPASAPASRSPRWTSTTKLLVGLVIVGIVAFLFIRFTSLLTPLLMVFILAYLLHPVATLIARGFRISWKAAVNILYFIILLLLIGLLTLGGVGLVGQVQSLIKLVQTIVADLPNYLETLSGQVFQIGPFTLDMRTVDLNADQPAIAFIRPASAWADRESRYRSGGRRRGNLWLDVLCIDRFLLRHGRKQRLAKRSDQGRSPRL